MARKQTVDQHCEILWSWIRLERTRGCLWHWLIRLVLVAMNPPCLTFVVYNALELKESQYPKDDTLMNSGMGQGKVSTDSLRREKETLNLSYSFADCTKEFWNPFEYIRFGDSILAFYSPDFPSSWGNQICLLWIFSLHRTDVEKIAKCRCTHQNQSIYYLMLSWTELNLKVVCRWTATVCRIQRSRRM